MDIVGLRAQITYSALGPVRGGKQSKDKQAVQNGLSQRLYEQSMDRKVV